MNPKGQKVKTDYLISGTSSGLGKYLLSQLGGITFNRKERGGAGRVIIHCAFNGNEITSRNLFQYISDNIFLTKTLVSIPHQKFIYISTVDVYPKDGIRHAESEEINLDKVTTMYGVAKLMAESMVSNLSPNFLILRCSALLGRDSKVNSLVKIKNESRPTLTLSPDSIFNYILHRDVLAFIDAAIKKDLRGIFNLAASENISLSSVANLFKKSVTFGDYVYNAGIIDNTKAVKVVSSFKKSSAKTISEFISSVL